MIKKQVAKIRCRERLQVFLTVVAILKNYVFKYYNPDERMRFKQRFKKDFCKPVNT